MSKITRRRNENAHEQQRTEGRDLRSGGTGVYEPGDPDTISRNPIDAVVPGGATTLFAVFAIIVCACLYWLIERHERRELEDALLRTAAEAAASLTKFRSFYSREVVTRLEGSDVLVTHEYKNKRNAIPLPATLSIEFGKFLEEGSEETSFRLVSDMPFPARSDRNLDAFERDAIAHLKQNPLETYYRYEDIGGRSYLRFAQGVAMEGSCVTCHNSHPQSPFKNWKVGDLRGIQEVTLPISSGEKSFSGSHDTFRDIVIFVVVAFTMALLSIFLLTRRNRLAFNNLERLAKLEQRRAAEIHKSKERVEEGLARLSALMDNVVEAIITIGEDGIIETANPAAESVFGYTRLELVGRNVSCLMTTSDARHHDDYIKRYCETGKARIIGIGREAIGRHKNGKEIPIELSISEVKLDDRRLFTGIVRDVSERKAAENALRQSEEQARKLSLVAARTDNAVIITDASGKVEWVNEGFTRIAGYEPDEIIGRKPGELLQREDVNGEAVERIRQALSAGHGFHEELLNYTKSGRSYWISIDAQPILDRHGRVQQFIALERDVTESKMRERDLEEARLRAEDASQAKSKFLAMMSHEVRTPLNGVIGALGLLRDTDLNEEQKKYAETSRASAESLLAIINDILDYSKMEADKLDLEPAPFNVRELVESVNDTFAMRCREKGIELIGDVEDSVPNNLVGDAARTRQVLANLLWNAVKFTEKGEIRLEINAVSLSPDRVLLTFAVKDTGSGVAPENQPNLFEEFWSGSPGEVQGSAGTGLGLAISKRLVTMMGGEIGVESAVGVGSRFWFRIPFTSGVADSAASEQVGPGTNPPQLLKGRILLAEDNPANQMISQAMLNKLGLSVDVVGNGLEAVEAIRSCPYDLVLMDIAMPEMDGIEATHRIRAVEGKSARTPVIAMTAHAMRGDREKFLAEGLDDYLVKPVSRAGLGACLARWLDEQPDPAENPSNETLVQDAILDPSTLERLTRDVGEEIMPELIETFLSELDCRIGLIEKAAEAEDFGALASQAHPLKSSSANFGAVALSRLASDIETAARAGDGSRSQAAALRARAVAQATRIQLTSVIESVLTS